MSLKDRQIQKAITAAIKEELSDGRTPTMDVVDAKVGKAFRDHPAGEMRFSFQPVKENEPSNPVAFNQTIESIHDDLMLAYEEVGFQNDQLMSMANAYETEKRLLQMSLRNLNKRTDALLDKIDYPSCHLIIRDAFINFNQVDFSGDEEKKIERTDTFIDLRTNHVTLQSVYRGAVRYDLTNATYVVQGTPAAKNQPKIETAELKPFAHVLRDTVNEAWQYVVTKEVVEPTTVQIDLTLPEAVEANLFSIQLHTAKEISISLAISEDNLSWKQLRTHTTYDQAIWMFDQPVKHMRVILTKADPDYANGTKLEYHFGALQINVRKEIYAPKSQLISQPYAIDNTVVDRVTLKTDEIIYPQTGIQYFIGIEEDGYPMEWQAIKTNETLELHQVGEESTAIDPKDPTYGEFVEKHFLVPFHSLITLPEAPLSQRTKLYVGDYMYKMETKPVDVEVTEEFMPTLQDWTEIKKIDTKYVPIEQTHEDRHIWLTPNSLQRFSVYVYCEAPEEMYNTEFTIGTAELQIYLNNSLVKPIVLRDEGVNGSTNLGITMNGEIKRYKYTYRFQAGWNKLEFLTYCKSEAQPFKPNLYFKEFSNRILAMKDPLFELSRYDLLNNTSKKDQGYFAIDGEKILVNYDPKSLDITGEGVRYLLDYDYLPMDAKRVSQLRFMAILTRNETSERITPILKGYKLILE